MFSKINKVYDKIHFLFGFFSAIFGIEVASSIGFVGYELFEAFLEYKELRENEFSFIKIVDELRKDLGEFYFGLIVGEIVKLLSEVFWPWV